MSNSNFIDVSKFIRRKPDMRVPEDRRTDLDKIVGNVKGMIKEKYPDWEGGICTDKVGKGHWEAMSFTDKSLTLYYDTLSHEGLAR